MEIPFNIPYVSQKEEMYLSDAIRRREFSAGGYYTKESVSLIREITACQDILLTSSCTHALEMCALLLDIGPGDEVIMSAYNFVSVANAFVNYGARIVFVDIEKESMNIDADLIEGAISPKTKAIVAMHYGSYPCDMDKIGCVAKKYDIPVIEDAAHCIGAKSSGKHLGTFGDLGCISFHSTKNIHCGEGGALLINNPKFIERAEIIQEKGTNRIQFLQKQVSKYTWVDKGSSYLMNELSAAFLLAQLEKLQEVNKERKQLFDCYFEFCSLHQIDCSPVHKGHNAHVFFIKTDRRDELIRNLKDDGIAAYFHYQALHNSKAGQKYGTFKGEDRHTSRESDRILRLPIYPGLKDIHYITQRLKQHWK